jgi:tRNA(Ile)-lysidine synthase
MRLAHCRPPLVVPFRGPFFFGTISTMTKRSDMTGNRSGSSVPEAKVASFFSDFVRAERRAGDDCLAGAVVLAAVSGGSDSVAMLCLLHEAAPRYGFALSAITVNHMIRSPAESSGDARFVADLCGRLDPPVPCALIDLAEGEVLTLAAKRGKGIEDAARHLRYRYFDEVSAKLGARFVCTGHTRDDQLETVLMRFLQGAGSSSLGGIAPRRGKFLRPVIECTRAELRDYLVDRGIGWREDATNADESYLRNRIRHTLVPLLSREFPGWDSGVLSASGRARSDERFCRSRMEPPWSNIAWTRSGAGISCDADEFSRLDPALRLRFLRDGLALLARPHRVSSRLLDRCARAPEDFGRASTGSRSGNISGGADPVPVIAGSGLVFRKDGNAFFWGPDIVQNSKSRYLVSIAFPGTYRLLSGSVVVEERSDGVYLDGRLGPFSLPLILRSRAGGDTVRMADGRQKTLKKLMNDWSVPASDRDAVPVVEQDGEIRAVYGGFRGYSDWFIHP